MNLAYLRSNVVVLIAPDDFAPPVDLLFDPPPRDATGANIGDTWNGSAFVSPPVPADQQNQITLRDQAEAALASNRTAIAQLVAWRTNGPGAGAAAMTSAQLSTAARQSALNQEAMFKQLNGLIRQLLNKFDGTD